MFSQLVLEYEGVNFSSPPCLAFYLNDKLNYKLTEKGKCKVWILSCASV